MIDCHCHILPGIDDGAQTMEDSIAMAKQAVADGVSTIFCTPHTYAADLEQQIQKRDAALEQLRAKLKEENIPLELIPGCEYYADGHSVENAIQRPSCRMGLRADAPILVELPMDLEMHLVADLNFRAQTRGVQMILAHPTRYNGFLDNVDMLKKCMDRGLWLQFNAVSFTLGVLFFKPVPKAILSLIKHNPSQILIGSDAHDAQHRTATISCAKKTICDKLGENIWKQITEDNPKNRLL